MVQVNQFARRLTALLGSRRFFIAVMAFFVLETLWIVFSADYPMAFDEDFHLGLIRLYAHHWLPFLNTQPQTADVYGAVARDPSYLFHYVMSFPYRLITLFTHSQTAQVIILRVMNVALFAVGLGLFARVLRRAKIGAPLVNVILLLFVLIPITPLLAAHINYDNLLMPLVAWVCLLSFQIIEALRRREIPARQVLLLMIVCLLTSLVKYAFLPIFLAAAIFLLLQAWLSFGKKWRDMWRAAVRSFAAISKQSKVVLVVLLVLSFGLFFQRYGVNAIRYHTPLPDCDDVLTVQRCTSYGPWNRDYNLAQQQQNQHFTPQPIQYIGSWFFGMWRRLFFIITGPTHNYQNYPPLPLPSLTAVVLALTGVFAVVMRWRPTLRGRPFLGFLLAIIFKLFRLKLCRGTHITSSNISD